MSRKVGSAAFALLVFAALIAFGYAPRIPLLAAWGKALGPYGYDFISNTIGIVVPIAALAIARRSLPIALRELGIATNPLRPFFFGLIATSPALIGFALTSHLDHSVTARAFFILCLYNPFAEEVLFRAFTFGQLYYRAGWNFWPAALVPTVLFAAGHLYQSSDPKELAGILAITGLGGIIFSYFFVRMGRTIWAPYALHAMLNTWWTIFTTNDTALGGWTDNVFRFGSIALAFLIVFAATRLPVFRLLAPRTGAWHSQTAEANA
jgi:membrane protease YdiL (CAAX protease family)